ncbi:MAG: UDP-N-acetylglucosamine 1-carboxyvinyltransferase [Lachnospiraceae bacterium]|nr:UDP-N-acetylglucosamine 1-carboxyvinyltransferase [Lachnospiraceae bacterium]
MNSIHIQGGVALQGKVRIQGSKNAVLPILAATLLTKETSYIRNCPRIADVYKMVSLLKSLGCSVSWDEGGIRINAERVCCGDMPVEAVTGMRSSLCLLGALIGRCGEVIMEHPGGCVIGERPIDLHIQALEQMGVVFREEEGRMMAFAQNLHGAEITLPFASVGATENIILAAVMAEGDTIVYGAAKEPEIEALCSYLECCGANIDGAGSSVLRIRGGRPLYDAEYLVPADRIVAGTYLFGCLGTGGNTLLEQAPWKDMKSVIRIAEQMGAQCTVAEEGLYVQAPERPKSIGFLRTEPYPGFPTDLQSMALAVQTLGDGDCVIEETIFENRFRVVEPLKKMGADIEVQGAGRILVRGRETLRGTAVEAKELRGGAALVLAGLMAEGETTITGCQYIYRGYENICRDLRELGARIISV